MPPFVYNTSIFPVPGKNHLDMLVSGSSEIASMNVHSWNTYPCLRDPFQALSGLLPARISYHPYG